MTTPIAVLRRKDRSVSCVELRVCTRLFRPAVVAVRLCGRHVAADVQASASGPSIWANDADWTHREATAASVTSWFVEFLVAVGAGVLLRSPWRSAC